MTAETLPAVNDIDLIQSFSFLIKAYEMSAEEKDRSVPIWEVGDEMGLNEIEAENLASNLQEMSLLYYSSLAGDIALTSFGVSEIVLARSQPDQATTHFPALSSFSDQMMLPLSNKQEPSMLRIVDQLEAFSAELLAESTRNYDLNPCIEELDETLKENGGGPQSLIAELEELQLDLLD